MPLEIFANNAQTTLNGAIDAVQTTIAVNAPPAGYPFPSSGNFRILIDSEIMLVTSVSGLTWTVVRGAEVGTTPGAAAASHGNGALVSQVGTAAGQVQAILDRVVVNVSGGTTSNALTAFASLVFGDANNVSFGLNGSTITASAGVAGPSGIALSAGTTLASTGTVVFSNSNGISFGLNGNTVTAAVAGAGPAAINISAGTTSNFSSAFTFDDANGVSFGLNNGHLTASITPVIGVGTITAFSQDADFVTNFLAVPGVMSFQKLSLPMNLQATQLALIADLNNGFSNSSGAVTISHAVYTLSGQTAHLASSASRQIFWGAASAGTSGPYQSVSGTRYRTLAVSYSMPPGDYLFAWWASSANGINCTVFGRAAMNIVGPFDGIETSYFLNGISAGTVAVFPSSIVATDVGYVRTGISALRQPGAILLGTS